MAKRNAWGRKRVDSCAVVLLVGASLVRLTVSEFREVLSGLRQAIVTEVMAEIDGRASSVGEALAIAAEVGGVETGSHW